VSLLSILEDFFWIVVFVASIAGPVVVLLLLGDAIFVKDSGSVYGNQEDK
jgi:hypothetical protein